MIIFSVRDEGVGLPARLDIIKTSAWYAARGRQQPQGDLQVLRRDPGIEFVLTIPPNLLRSRRLRMMDFVHAGPMLTEIATQYGPL